MASAATPRTGLGRTVADTTDLRIASVTSPGTLSGLPQVADRAALDLPPEGWFHDPTQRALWVKLRQGKPSPCPFGPGGLASLAEIPQGSYEKFSGDFRGSARLVSAAQLVARRAAGEREGRIPSQPIEDRVVVRRLEHLHDPADPPAHARHLSPTVDGAILREGRAVTSVDPSQTGRQPGTTIQWTRSFSNMQSGGYFSSSRGWRSSGVLRSTSLAA